MVDFQSILDAARQLPESDRVRLMYELWETVPLEAEFRFSEEWGREIEKRLAELRDGSVKTIPWEQIREETLGRFPHANSD